MSKLQEKRVKRKKTMWNNTFYVRAYQFAVEGLSNKKISVLLNLSHAAFLRRVKEDSALMFALREARGNKDKRTSSITFRDYIYNRLPKHLRRLWKKINRCEEEPNGIARLNALFAKEGEDARKHIFLYALTSGYFNPSDACRKVGLTRRELNKWIEKDMDFAELMDDIHFHKQNFCESKLFEKVDEGDTAVVIMANRTLNRDRGYGEKVDVEIKGSIDHNHLIRLEDLPISTKLLRKVYKAIEEHATQELETGKEGQKLLVDKRKEGSNGKEFKRLDSSGTGEG